MGDQGVRTSDSSPGIPWRGRAAVFVLLVPFSLASAAETSGDHNAVRVRRITTPTYVSLIVENLRAYDVTVTPTIRTEGAQGTRLVPETATYGGYTQLEAAKIAVVDPRQTLPVAL